MTIAALAYISDMMQSLSIPYAFPRWDSLPPDDYYFTGEYIESTSQTLEENGFQETTFILRGYTRQAWLLLEQAKAKIEATASKTAILSDGTGIAVSYDSGTIVPTGDAELKSIKINLNIKEWKVN